jgi:FkbM family methyltransferase
MSNSGVERSKLRPLLRKPFSFTGKLFYSVANALYVAPPEPRLTQTQRVQPWYNADGDERLRLDYDLDANSIVFDLGGYEGQWASDINAMYGSRVLIFEPMPSYASNIKRRFAHNRKLEVFTFGLSDHDYHAELSEDLASSSLFKKTERMVKIELKDAADFIKQQHIDRIDLMKINIEGGEYDVLDRLIETGLIDKITDLQVQFHDFAPNSDKHMAKIQAALRKTHYPTYQYPYVWENWRHNSTLVALAKQAPRVSVLMAAYNSESFLKEAIDSILAQSFADFELIIINDGSSDKSEGIVKGYSDPRIRYFAQENGGLGAALNRGIKEARGEYIARMDSDDISLPTRLQTQLNYLDQHSEVALVGTSYDVVDAKLRHRETFSALTNPEDVKNDFFVRNPFGHGTVMFRKEIINKVGSYDAERGKIEDYEFWWRISQAYTVANVAESLYLWRIVSSGISHGDSDKRQKPIQDLVSSIWTKGSPSPCTITGMRQRLAEYAAAEPSEVGPRLAKQYLMNQYALGLGLISQGRRWQGWKWIAQAWWTTPNSFGYVVKLYYFNRSMCGYNLQLMLKPLSLPGRLLRRVLARTTGWELT